MEHPVNPATAPQLRLIQRETVLLVFLCVLAIVAFFVTRAVAGANRRMQRADAAHWYQIGQAELASQDPTAAITALRRASTLNRDSREYRLALASALLADHHELAARDVLRELQSRFPQDPDVNLRLARLDAAAGRPDDAVREYQTALIEMWAPSRADERRSLRLELIDFLLSRNDAGRALSEAIALTADIPDTAEAHVEAGRLLLRCGAPTRALDQFEAALQRAAGDAAALAGAAEAAFDTSDYDRARRYLRAAPSTDRVNELRGIVDLMFATDPLLPHLTSAAREARVRTALDRVSDQIAACGAKADGLAAEAGAIRQSLTGRPGHSADSIGADLGSVARLAKRVGDACGAAPIDRALDLIARRHGVDQP